MTESEQVVADFFADRGLRAQRFARAETRSGKKTPDFRVFRENALQFYCEVKETTDADPLEDHMVEVDPGIFLGEQCKINDISRHSRFANRISGAVEQFDSVNPDLSHPNVLAFVNTDDSCAPSILQEVLQGYLTQVNNIRIHTCPSSISRRAQENGVRVHLFLWLNRVHGEHFVKFFPWNRHDQPTVTLADLFPEVYQLIGMAQKK